MIQKRFKPAFELYMPATLILRATGELAEYCNSRDICWKEIISASKDDKLVRVRSVLNLKHNTSLDWDEPSHALFPKFYNLMLSNFDSLLLTLSNILNI